MGYETTSGQPQGRGGETALPPEAVSPYAEFGHAELIDRFYETEGDPAIGTELSVRLFAHAGVPADPRTEPLRGRDGTQVQLGGKLLMLADYVNYAAMHHFEAVEDILSFLMMQSGTQDYEMVRATMVGRLSSSGR